MLASASCTDGVRNQDESAIDCGGPDCGPCDEGLRCFARSDCESGVCDFQGFCSAPACNDAVLNGNETDFDCGGPQCGLCANGRRCGSAGDCFSGVCTPPVGDAAGQLGTCAAGTCSDGIRNGIETDIDCGGAGRPVTTTRYCINAACPTGECCSLFGQCGTSQAHCQWANADGACAPCALAAQCVGDADCASGRCVDSTCASQTAATSLDVAASRVSVSTRQLTALNITLSVTAGGGDAQSDDVQVSAVFPPNTLDARIQSGLVASTKVLAAPASDSGLVGATYDVEVGVLSNAQRFAVPLLASPDLAAVVSASGRDPDTVLSAADVLSVNVPIDAPGITVLVSLPFGVAAGATTRSGSSELAWYAHAGWRSGTGGAATVSDAATSVGVARVVCDEAVTCSGNGDCAAVPDPSDIDGAAGQPAGECRCDTFWFGASCSTFRLNASGTGAGGGGGSRGAGTCEFDDVGVESWVEVALPPSSSAPQRFAAVVAALVLLVPLARSLLCCGPKWHRIVGIEEDDSLVEPLQLKPTWRNRLMVWSMVSDAVLCAAPAFVVDVPWVDWVPLRVVTRAVIADGLRSQWLYILVAAIVAIVVTLLLLRVGVANLCWRDPAERAHRRQGRGAGGGGGGGAAGGGVGMLGGPVVMGAGPVRGAVEDTKAKAKVHRAPRMGAGCWLPPTPLVGFFGVLSYLLSTVLLLPALTVLLRPLQCGMPFPLEVPLDTNARTCEDHECWSPAHIAVAAVSALLCCALIPTATLGFAAQLAADAHGFWFDNAEAFNRSTKLLVDNVSGLSRSSVQFRPVVSFIRLNVACKVVLAWDAAVLARMQPGKAIILCLVVNCALLLRACFVEVAPLHRVRWLPRATYLLSSLAAAMVLVIHHARVGAASSWLPASQLGPDTPLATSLPVAWAVTAALCTFMYTLHSRAENPGMPLFAAIGAGYDSLAGHQKRLPQQPTPQRTAGTPDTGGRTLAPLPGSWRHSFARILSFGAGSSMHGNSGMGRHESRWGHARAQHAAMAAAADARTPRDGGHGGGGGGGGRMVGRMSADDDEEDLAPGGEVEMIGSESDITAALANRGGGSGGGGGASSASGGGGDAGAKKVSRSLAPELATASPSRATSARGAMVRTPTRTPAAPTTGTPTAGTASAYGGGGALESKPSERPREGRAVKTRMLTPKRAMSHRKDPLAHARTVAATGLDAGFGPSTHGTSAGGGFGGGAIAGAASGVSPSRARDRGRELGVDVSELNRGNHTLLLESLEALEEVDLAAAMGAGTGGKGDGSDSDVRAPSPT